MNKNVFLIFILAFISYSTSAFFSATFAQEVYQSYQGTYKAEVVNILEQEERLIPGTDTPYLFQKIEAEVLDGPQKGTKVHIENDYTELDEGDRFYFNHNVYIDGREIYGITNIDRSSSIFLLVAIFVGVVLFFGGKQGARSLLALSGSFFAIFYILLPGLVKGWDPLVASSLVAGAILFVAIFFTHGFNKESLVAYGGTMISVFITSLFAAYAVNSTDLTGFASDESIYLNFNTKGAIDFVDLLLGAIIIGVLGVLDDISITQAAVVTELYNSNEQMSRYEVYRRALRVGREHVGALVNTLVLAYAGTSLPLLLFFYMSPHGFISSINSEVFATEIVRTIVGSVGLIFTVPVVTLLAVFYLKGYKSKSGHSHHHHHHHDNHSH